MKRSLLHIGFWLVYLVQDTLLHFTWMAAALQEFSGGEQLWLAVQTSLLVLPPKLLVVYYFNNFGVKKLLANRKHWLRPVTEMSVLLLVSLVWFRLSFYYLVNPHIYLKSNPGPLFDARNLLISILEIGYIAGIAIAFKLLRLQTSSREREQVLVKEKLQTELKFLRNQIHPHFLFNTLNNIYALARKKSDKTPEVVMKLSELLSFMLYETSKPTIALAEEIKMIEDYIHLEKIRYTEKLSVQLHKKIDNGCQPISPLLLLPLVENAFKHGISEARFDSFIRINIHLARARLHFCIENSIENGKEKVGNGSIGLNILKRQLDLMYKEHELIVDKNETTFKVDITINLDSDGKV